MKTTLVSTTSALLVALATGVGPTSAGYVAGDDRSFLGVTDPYPARSGGWESKGVQLVKETSSTKTVVKEKKDGTVVTKTTTKANDGEGNKSTTRTTTTSSGSSDTSQPQSGGSGGDSKEGL